MAAVVEAGSTLGVVEDPEPNPWEDVLEPSMLDVVTPAGWVTFGLGLALFVIGVLLDQVETAIVGAALLGAFLLAAVWMWGRPRLEATRVIEPARLIDGEEARGVITVRNVGRRRSPAVMADERFGKGRLTLRLPSLAPGVVSTTSYSLPSLPRGRYQIGPLSVAHTDPLRLMRAGRTYSAMTSLLVHPRTFKVPPLPSGRVRDLEGLANRRVFGSGVTFHTLREYVPGDDLRLIHWRSTARTGTLMLRHNVVTTEPQMAVFLDCCRSVYASDAAFEDAVSVAASLVEAGIASHYPVEFHASSGLGGYVDPTGKGRMHVLDLLAEVEATADDPGIAELARLVDRRHAAVSLGVVTGHPRAGDAAAVSRSAGRFGAASVIQIGDRWDAHPFRIPGAFVMHAPTAADFAERWTKRFGS